MNYAVNCINAYNDNDNDKQYIVVLGHQLTYN